MAANPYPYWVTEQSPTHHGPTSGILLRLAVITIIAVICWQWFTATDSGRGQVDQKPGLSLCEEHHGQPGWTSVCRETARRIPVSDRR